MRKKTNPQGEFDRYWKTHINEVIRRKIEFVVDSHQKEILKFWRKWNIPLKGFTNRRSYNKWLKAQAKSFSTKPQLVYEQRAEIPIGTKGLEIKIPEETKFRKSQIQTIKIRVYRA